MRLTNLMRRLHLNSVLASPQSAATNVLKIHDISLHVNSMDAGGTQYDSKSSYEECASPLYAEIAKWLEPQLVIDIGANYGFTALVFAKRFPQAQLVLVEPSPLLEEYIRTNLSQNGVLNYELIMAACGKGNSGSISFALNPHGSQDNRVE